MSRFSTTDLGCLKTLLQRVSPANTSPCSFLEDNHKTRQLTYSSIVSFISQEVVMSFKERLTVAVAIICSKSDDFLNWILHPVEETGKDLLKK
jgi:hypothetical protein